MWCYFCLTNNAIVEKWLGVTRYFFPLCWLSLCNLLKNAIIICIFFFFIPFPHLLGKTEEECSFHTLEALLPSRKWATEDTKITLPSSNARDTGLPWYATRFDFTSHSFFGIAPPPFSAPSPKTRSVGGGDPSQCIRQDVWYLQLFLWVLYMIMSVLCNKSPAVIHAKLKGHDSAGPAATCESKDARHVWLASPPLKI